MDNMITWMNKHHGDKFFLKYSTPSNYVDAINKQNVTWPTKYDDMFPYSDNPDAYWTGYFTSRANLKEYVRVGSHNLHASAQLYSLHTLNSSMPDAQKQDIFNAHWGMQDIMGILQHHDAVAGTAKQAVANDYAWRLSTAMDQNNLQYSKLLSSEIKKTTGIELDEQLLTCDRTNGTYHDCPVNNFTK